jgi:hypothetical protein
MALDVVDGSVHDAFGFVREPTPAKAATDHLDLIEESSRMEGCATSQLSVIWSRMVLFP